MRRAGKGLRLRQAFYVAAACVAWLAWVHAVVETAHAKPSPFAEDGSGPSFLSDFQMYSAPIIAWAALLAGYLVRSSSKHVDAWLRSFTDTWIGVLVASAFLAIGCWLVFVAPGFGSSMTLAEIPPRDTSVSRPLVFAMMFLCGASLAGGSTRRAQGEDTEA
jgi:hypothetical protein